MPGRTAAATTASEPQPLLAGAAGYVRSVDVVRPFGSEVELRIGWAQARDVRAHAVHGWSCTARPTVAARKTPRVTVKETTGATSTYAVNLTSSTTPFTPEALAAAARTVGVRTYVSEIVVDEQRWYRLRAGPFVTEGDARQALGRTRAPRIPKAWIAIPTTTRSIAGHTGRGRQRSGHDPAAERLDDAGRDQEDDGAGARTHSVARTMRRPFRC